MIDGIKLHYTTTDREIDNLKNRFEFFAGKVSIRTANVAVRRIKASYRNFTITIAGKHVTIQGSLHKSFNDGTNYNQFSYSKIIQAVATLSAEVGIPPHKLTIQNMEAGVNITNASISFGEIERNAIAYKNKPFADYKKGGVTFGKYIQQQRYILKIYNKSIQECLPIEIIRAELKFVKSIHLHSTGIYTLADLTNRSHLNKLGVLLGKHFSNILMNDMAAISQADLSTKDRMLYLEGSNPYYWKNLTTSATHKRRNFERLISVYGGSNLTKMLVSNIMQHWQQLLGP